MRKLTNAEINTVIFGSEHQIAKVEVDGIGLDEHSIVHHQILVKKCEFKPDVDHKNEAASDGYSLCYKIELYTDCKIAEIKYFTQCFESDIFIRVGNYIGTVYMMNTLADSSIDS